MYFGGLPLAKEKPTMVIDSKPTAWQLNAAQKKIRDKPKKFSTEAFLDLYLKEKAKPVTTFQEVESQIAQEKEAQ